MQPPNHFSTHGCDPEYGDGLRLTSRRKGIGISKMGNWIKWKYGIHSPGLPKMPACYVAYLDNEIVYIGQTSNLYKRFYQHNIRFGYSTSIMTPWGQAKSVMVKYRPQRKYGDWAMMEVPPKSPLEPANSPNAIWLCEAGRK